MGRDTVHSQIIAALAMIASKLISPISEKVSR